MPEMMKDPIVIDPEVVCELGLDRAVMLERLTLMAKRLGVEHEGRQWIPFTVRGIQEQLPWWSVATTHRLLRWFMDRGAVSVKLIPGAGFVRWLSPKKIKCENGRLTWES